MSQSMSNPGVRYTGMDAATGARLSGLDHLRQSVGKILGTAIGERLRRRPFGSLAPSLVDAPANTMTFAQLYSAAATALLAWEPRLIVRRVSAQADAARPGLIVLTVHAEALVDGAAAHPIPIAVSVPLGG